MNDLSHKGQVFMIKPGTYYMFRYSKHIESFPAFTRFFNVDYIPRIYNDETGEVMNRTETYLHTMYTIENDQFVICLHNYHRSVGAILVPRELAEILLSQCESCRPYYTIIDSKDSFLYVWEDEQNNKRYLSSEYQWCVIDELDTEYLELLDYKLFREVAAEVGARYDLDALEAYYEEEVAGMDARDKARYEAEYIDPPALNTGKYWKTRRQMSGRKVKV